MMRQPTGAAALGWILFEGGIMTASADTANEHYPSYADYLFAVADALAEEYRAINGAGLLLQVDDPALTDVLGDTELSAAAVRHGVACDGRLDRDAKLDLLMGLVVGPQLGRESPCFICDYPASQAALVRLKTGQPRVAARFELYVDGLELANGFHELADPAEQRVRFTQDLATRRARGLVQPPVDEHLLAALDAGMPDCAGVALGFDRLVAIDLQCDKLADAMAFTIENA